MSKIYLDDIQDTGRFHGTEDELLEIFKRSKEREWKHVKVGAVDVFTFHSFLDDQSEPLRMYWWRDTGDVMFRWKNRRTAHMAVEKCAGVALEKTPKETSVVRDAPNDKQPLAQQFVRQPHKLMWDYFETKKYSPKKRGSIKRLIAKTMNIKILREDPSAWEGRSSMAPERRIRRRVQVPRIWCSAKELSHPKVSRYGNCGLLH